MFKFGTKPSDIQSQSEEEFSLREGKFQFLLLVPDEDTSHKSMFNLYAKLGKVEDKFRTIHFKFIAQPSGGDRFKEITAHVRFSDFSTFDSKYYRHKSYHQTQRSRQEADNNYKIFSTERISNSANPGRTRFWHQSVGSRYWGSHLGIRRCRGGGV
jgi:hypothetical protein